MTQIQCAQAEPGALRTAGRKANPQVALSLAAETWSQGEKIEMSALAEKLGVTRVTLFRWVGNHDQLLAEVLWTQWDLMWQASLLAAKGKGPAYIADVCRRVMSGILRSHGMSSFIANDPEYALRMLTSKNSSVQSRVIDSVRLLLEDEISRGHLDPPLEVDALAYAMVRIVESFLYSDQIAGRTPDPDVPSQVITLLLRP